MSAPITFMTSHPLAEREAVGLDSRQRSFAEYVAAHQPRLLDFHAYVNQDKSELKLFFVFPDDGEGERVDASAEPMDRPFRDSGWAGLLAAAAIVVLVFIGVFLGSVSPIMPA
jgi:hypothetical protein